MTIVVDPGDAEPVLAFLHKKQLTLTGVSHLKNLKRANDNVIVVF